ncbi:MAG: Holliday junction branch migration protein RuvA [Victivallaceae bacterium]|nr:Holliday junction branch migration protein RuvA [Victivallaceae bacterium]
MIARLRGRVWEKNFGKLVLDVQGVGYALQIPLSTYEALPEPGGEAELHVYTQVREDAIVLFGFSSAPEKSLFELLLGVTGIGGKLALSVLSALPVSGFCRAITNRELAILGKIPGIGKRTAERLVMELRDKLGTLAAGATPAPGRGETVAAPQAVADAALALEQLGFKHDAAMDVLFALTAELPEADLNSGNLLRLALQQLSRG